MCLIFVFSLEGVLLAISSSFSFPHIFDIVVVPDALHPAFTD